MSNKPVVCIQVNEEAQLCLLKERQVEDYLALIVRNQEYLCLWIDVEAYEGTVETLKAYVKQWLLRFVNGEGYHLGIWYQDANQLLASIWQLSKSSARRVLGLLPTKRECRVKV